MIARLQAGNLRHARDQKWHVFVFADALAFVREVAGVADDAVLDLELGGRGADVGELVRHAHEFLEIQRSVIERAREAEAVFDQHGFARFVAFIHAADLRDGGVRFVDHEEIIFREKIEQREGLRTGRPAGEMARVVLDAVAEAHLLQHFEIVFRAHFQALRFEEAALRFEQDDAFVQLVADGGEGAIQLIGGRDELFRGEKGEDAELFARVAGHRIETRDGVDLVAEKFEPDRFFIGGGGIDFHHVAADAEFAAPEFDIVSAVKHIDEPAEHRFAGNLLALFHREQHAQIILRRGDAVDAGDARDHDGVAPREERAGGGEAQALDLFVDRRILLDVGVGARDVGLGLVIIEIADEIFDGVAREELLELGVELRRERLVVRDDERRAIQFLDHVRHRERLPRAGDAEERLVTIAGLDRLQQFRDRLRLIAARFVIRFELEGHRAR